MGLKRLLLLAPVVVLLALLQSYVWVPTYDKQASGNPARLVNYIEGSIGEPKILNPILNADTASSRVTDLVFEGLLDLDEQLELRGRLATDWQVRENAGLLVNPAARLPDGSRPDAPGLAARIQEALAAGRLPGLAGVVTQVEALPAERREQAVSVLQRDEAGQPRLESVPVQVEVPARVRLSLSRVEPDLFEALVPVIGRGYAEGFPYEQFVRIDGDVEPALADAARAQLPELLPVEEHNPVLVFELRRGVRFHDGHEFDAGDVLFTYQSIMEPRNISPRTSDWEPIQSVEVVDRFTVRVTYKRLFSPATYAWTMGILPEHLLNEARRQAEMERRGVPPERRESFGMREMDFNRAPVGTGPFRFVEWRPGEYVHLERYEDYFEGAPEYRDLFLRVLPDPVTQEVEFKSGAIDVYSPQPHQVKRYRGDPRYRTFTRLGYGYSYIGWNLRREPFDDPRVRRALAMAIDVDEIIRYVLYGEGERVTGPYPPNTPWYDPDVEAVPYDPEGALALLRAAGFERNAEGVLERDGKSLEFRLITNHGNPVRNAIMTIAQAAWRRIGVRCHLGLFEWAVFLNDFVNTGEFDAIVLGWSLGIDPDQYQIFHSSQTGPQQLNFVGYESPEADRLIEQIRREYDVGRQTELAHAFHRLIARDQPYLFLYAGLGTTVMDRKIVRVEHTPEGEERYARIELPESGLLYFHFREWRKLEHDPGF